VKVFLDNDSNPYNGNDQMILNRNYPSTGTNSVFFGDLSLPSTDAAPGTYAVYAKITTGSHSRYLYAPEVLTINPNLQSPRFNPALSTMQPNGLFRLSLSGAVGQKVIIQASTSLTAWVPISTNSFSSTNIINLDVQVANYRARFYRAMLAP
jgi:hypothetical protein